VATKATKPEPEKEGKMIFGGRLKNFFDWLELEYLDKIPAWVFVLLGFTLAIIIMCKKIIRGPRCPRCGAKILLVKVDEIHQINHWKCSQCDWEHLQEFN